MKLLINTASTFKGGGIQVARSFLEECLHYPEHEFHVVLGRSLACVLDPATFPDNFSFYPIGYRPATRVFSLKSKSSFLRSIEKEVRPDVVFTTLGPAYWRPEAPHLAGYALAHYVYPDSPFWSTISPYRRVRWMFKSLMHRYYFMHDADAYVVETDDINKRVRRFLKTDRVFTVSNTCSGYYFQPTSVNDKLPAKGDEFRLLTLSAWYLHKRLGVIPEVLHSLPVDVRQRVRFVLTLPDEDFAQHFRGSRKEHIINVGPVRIEDGPALYRECDALFLPTLLECFSASYAEAMAMGLPIVTSDLEFARCVCQKAALYFDPMKPEDIAEKISMLVRSSELRRELVERGKVRLPGFGSARSRAEQYLHLCEQLARGAV